MKLHDKQVLTITISTPLILSLFAEGSQIQTTILFWRAVVKSFNATQSRRFVLQQNEVRCTNLLEVLLKDC